MKIRILILMALLSTLCSTSFAQSYQNQLKNKYLILNGASCAGLKFNLKRPLLPGKMKWTVAVATPIAMHGALPGLHQRFL